MSKFANFDIIFTLKNKKRPKYTLRTLGLFYSEGAP